MARAVTTLVVFVLLTVVSSPAAVMCTCNRSSPICSAFASAEAVFVGVVTRVQNDPTSRGSRVSHRAQVKIEESFNGPKTGELVFRSYGEDCDVTYQEGQRWVFYAVYHSASSAWHIHGCARSRLIEAAADDLLYLRNLPASAQKTRLSGELCCGPDNKRLSGITIRVLGEQETFEAITDKNGVYEIYNLTPGKYFVEPKVPSNMEILPEPWEPVKPKDRVGKDVVLREKGCAVADFLVADRKNSGSIQR